MEATGCPRQPASGVESRSMSRRLAPVAAAALVALGAAGAAAQAPPIDLSPFYHAVTAGAGARAWGMAGAQVALSDSAEAVTWNPAAAAALPRPSALAVFSGDQLTGEYDDVRFALTSGPTGSITPGPTTASLSRLQALPLPSCANSPNRFSPSSGPTAALLNVTLLPAMPTQRA